MSSLPFTPPMVRAILAGRKTQTRRFLSKRTGKPELHIGSTPYVREAWRVPARFYANLWSLIHGAGSWDENPIVVVYDFRQEMRR